MWYVMLFVFGICSSFLSAMDRTIIVEKDGTIIRPKNPTHNPEGNKGKALGYHACMQAYWDAFIKGYLSAAEQTSQSHDAKVIENCKNKVEFHAKCLTYLASYKGNIVEDQEGTRLLYDKENFLILLKHGTFSDPTIVQLPQTSDRFAKYSVASRQLLAIDQANNIHAWNLSSNETRKVLAGKTNFDWRAITALQCFNHEISVAFFKSQDQTEEASFILTNPEKASCAIKKLHSGAVSISYNGSTGGEIRRDTSRIGPYAYTHIQWMSLPRWIRRGDDLTYEPDVTAYGSVIDL